MKSILICDCDEKEMKQFAEGLQIFGERICVKSHIANWARKGYWSEFRRYQMYLCVGMRYFLRRKEYGLIIGWQQFYALIVSFFCSLFQTKKSGIIVALNYTYKDKRGLVGKLYRWFMFKCMNPVYLDYIHVPSNSYADYIAREFNYPRNKILVTFFGIDDIYNNVSLSNFPKEYENGKYMLAIGRSNRDFDFLVNAWMGIEYPLVIISDTFRGMTEDKNIAIYRNFHGEASYPWIRNCRAMIIPIDDGAICSGDTVLLLGMSMQKTVLVTEPSTLAEMYVKDGETALTISKDILEFRKKIEFVLSNLDREIGVKARASFLHNYSRASMAEAISLFLNNELSN